MAINVKCYQTQLPDNMSGTAPRETCGRSERRAIGPSTTTKIGAPTTWWCDDGAYEPVSTALLMTVSSVLGVEPHDLEALSECVEPDALNALFIHWRGDEPPRR